MKKSKKTPALLIFILAIAGNISVCSGRELSIGFPCNDSVPRWPSPPPVTYMYVQEKLDGTCHVAYNDVLRIHYEEPYAVSNHQRLRFRIYDQHRNLLVGTDEAGVIDNANCADTLSPMIKTGENWLTINLSCLNTIEDDHHYYLEVWNGKGEISYLRFVCLPYIQPY